jgi:PAS domain-containing protein
MCEVAPTCRPSKIIEYASFALVSHGTEADPVFNYANPIALDLFEAEFSEFTGMPSRYSAGTMEQEERQQLLDEVSRHGFYRGYRGLRRSLRGREFFIEDAVIWNVADRSGQYIGQAAKIDHWTYTDGLS